MLYFRDDFQAVLAFFDFVNMNSFEGGIFGRVQTHIRFTARRIEEHCMPAVSIEQGSFDVFPFSVYIAAFGNDLQDDVIAV